MCTPAGELCAFLGGGKGQALVIMCCGPGMGGGVLETSLPVSHSDSSSRIVEYSLPVFMRHPLWPAPCSFWGLSCEARGPQSSQ